MHQLEKLALLGEVATGIAHEINQPLAAIAMAAQNGTRALGTEPPRLARAGEKFTLIQAQAERINAVITHIRAFGRTGDGQAGPVDVACVIADTASLLVGRLRQDQVVLATQVAEDLPRVIGVAVMLEQVVMNLIVNAVDAYRARPDLAERRIEVRAAVVEGALRIEVADQAGGIAANLLSRIFDPFFTTKPVGAGTGLGLSISMATVAAMGGRLGARNVGGGACFEIVLPLPAGTEPQTSRAGCLMSPGPV
jgi:C4-dicarboxylate-specific signal transduction histidine kinase